MHKLNPNALKRENRMYRDLTQGSITKGLLLFAAPMVAGNLLQQLCNIADTLIVGQALGRNALASVGSAFTLMTFLTSVFLGFSMGAGALFSIYLGRGSRDALRRAVAHAFVLILLVTLVLTLAVYLFIDPILRFLQIPQELYEAMRTYLLIIFAGLAATFLYNFFACLLRAAGNSVAPLWFLGAAALLNIGLDLLFVLGVGWGVAGAAAAVKIDAFAYLPVQDFGNAFSTFVAQNYGAGQTERLRQGLRQATLVSVCFSCAISVLVVLLAQPLMRIFVQAGETEVLAAGVQYLRIEGAFYASIGCLFLLYGFYRAVKCPGMSVVLTVISLGVRVALAYALAGPVGPRGIWAAIPIGWFLADAVGYGYYFRCRARLLAETS